MKRFFLYLTLTCEVIIIFILAINVAINALAKPYIYQTVEEAPKAEAVMIPGAPVFANGTLSSIFQDRVDLAIRLYNAKRVSKILVSGDNGTASHNEVNPVRNYLLAQGIPDQDIFLDHAGFDTYSSMYRARDIFAATSLLIATQSFHLPRAVFIARELGIDAHGVIADNGPSLWTNYLREVFADEKALLDVFLHVQPKYLGEQIPLTSDSTDNPHP